MKRKSDVHFPLVFCFVVFFSLVIVIKSAPGDLDFSFGNKGKVITSFSAANDWIEDIALQKDGKIVAVGRIGFEPSVASAFGVARYNSNGTLDKSFGNGGMVTTLFTRQFAFAESVVIQPDGKIVVCGRTSTNSGNEYREFIAVARYLSNGSLDSGFSQDGKVETSLGLYSVGNAVAIQTDGKIVVTGSTGREIAVVRYNTDGTPDKRFGYSGRTITSITTESDGGNAVKIQADGKILVAGSTDMPRPSSPPNPSYTFFAVVRFNSTNGKVDTSFDFDGIQSTTFYQFYSIAYDIALQPDGKIVVAGFSQSGNANVFAIARYNSNGSLDTSFDDDGMLITHPGGLEGVAYEIEIQPDGKIIAGGSMRDAAAPGYSNFMMIRYNSNGALDNTFGVAGKVRVSMSSHYDEIRAMALQNDGCIVVGGAATNESNISDFALARFLAD